MTNKKPQLTEERNTFKPFKYPWAYDAWLQHEQSHWLHTEVPMGEDLKDYQKKLGKEEKAQHLQINVCHLYLRAKYNTR